MIVRNALMNRRERIPFLCKVRARKHFSTVRDLTRIWLSVRKGESEGRLLGGCARYDEGLFGCGGVLVKKTRDDRFREIRAGTK